MRRILWLAIAILLGVRYSSANAGDPPASASAGPLFAVPFDGANAIPTVEGGHALDCATTRQPEDPPDLTLWNFFSAGWDEDFTRRSSEDRAPDLALLRVQTNFMEREFRVNYADTSNQRSKTNKNLSNLDYFIAYAFDRRFMIEVLGNEQWQEARTGLDSAGPAPRVVGRVQLISTADSSYTFNFQVISPDTQLGQHATTVSYGLAGFEDLTRFGLYRMGFYYSALFDSFAGPEAVGTRRTDVQYDVTIAKTFTRPDTPIFGNFTAFLETFAQTDLDGVTSGHTLVSMTPGIRFNLGKLPGIKLGLDNWLMFGTDVSIGGPKPWDTIYRFTYIKNF